MTTLLQYMPFYALPRFACTGVQESSQASQLPLYHFALPRIPADINIHHAAVYDTALQYAS